MNELTMLELEWMLLKGSLRCCFASSFQFTALHAPSRVLFSNFLEKNFISLDPLLSLRIATISYSSTHHYDSGFPTSVRDSSLFISNCHSIVCLPVTKSPHKVHLLLPNYCQVSFILLTIILSPFSLLSNNLVAQQTVYLFCASNSVELFGSDIQWSGR